MHADTSRAAVTWPLLAISRAQRNRSRDGPSARGVGSLWDGWATPTGGGRWQVACAEQRTSGNGAPPHAAFPSSVQVPFFFLLILSLMKGSGRAQAQAELTLVQHPFLCPSLPIALCAVAVSCIQARTETGVPCYVWICSS
jgi:hypothetical protein